MLFFRQMLERVGRGFQRLGRLCHVDGREKRVAEWQSLQGDKTLRLDYDLSSDAVVFDVGGYEGQWASDIYSRFNCRIHIFEPIPTYADQIRKRFQRNPQICVHPFGLAASTRRERMSVNGDASSEFK